MIKTRVWLSFALIVLGLSLMVCPVYARPIANDGARIVILDFYNLSNQIEYEEWESRFGRSLRRAVFATNRVEVVPFPRIAEALKKLNLTGYYVSPEKAPQVGEALQADLVVVSGFSIVDGIIASSIKIIDSKSKRILKEDTLFGEESDVDGFVKNISDAVVRVLFDDSGQTTSLSPVEEVDQTGTVSEESAGDLPSSTPLLQIEVSEPSVPTGGRIETESPGDIQPVSPASETPAEQQQSPAPAPPVDSPPQDQRVPIPQVKTIGINQALQQNWSRESTGQIHREIDPDVVRESPTPFVLPDPKLPPRLPVSNPPKPPQQPPHTVVNPIEAEIPSLSESSSADEQGAVKSPFSPMPIIPAKPPRPRPAAQPPASNTGVAAGQPQQQMQQTGIAPGQQQPAGGDQTRFQNFDAPIEQGPVVTQQEKPGIIKRFFNFVKRPFTRSESPSGPVQPSPAQQQNFAPPVSNAPVQQQGVPAQQPQPQQENERSGGLFGFFRR